MAEPQSPFEVYGVTGSAMSREVRRIAVEMQRLPFVPRKFELASFRCRQGIQVATSGPRSRLVQVSGTGQYGAPVYFDILHFGGRGTRRDVLIAVEAMASETAWLYNGQDDLHNPDFCPFFYENVAATALVAARRAVGSNEVTKPVFPREAQQFFGRTVIIDSFARTEAAWLGEEITGRLEPRRRRWQFTKDGEFTDDFRSKLRLMWQMARRALADDTPVWLEEMETVRSVSHRQTQAPRIEPRGRRMIKLHED